MRQPFAQAFPQLTTPSPEWGSSIGRAVSSMGAGYSHSWVVYLGEPAVPPWPHEARVELKGADGEVVRGHHAVAWVMVNATLDLNPSEMANYWMRWEAEGRAADDSERAWERGWERGLEENPKVAWALARSPERLYRLVGLQEHHKQAMRLKSQGLGSRAIGRAMGRPESTVRGWLEEALASIRRLGRPNLQEVLPEAIAQ